jgi:hypothetical protein
MPQLLPKEGVKVTMMSQDESSFSGKKNSRNKGVTV